MKKFEILSTYSYTNDSPNPTVEVLKKGFFFPLPFFDLRGAISTILEEI